MADEYMPKVWDDNAIREAFIDDGGLSEYHDPINGAQTQRRSAGGIFDRWLAVRDREVAAKALREFRAGFGRRFAFQDPYGHFDPSTVSALHRQVEGMLDAEADRIELQASERGASDGEQ